MCECSSRDGGRNAHTRAYRSTEQFDQMVKKRLVNQIGIFNYVNVLCDKVTVKEYYPKTHFYAIIFQCYRITSRCYQITNSMQFTIREIMCAFQDIFAVCLLTSQKHVLAESLRGGQGGMGVGPWSVKSTSKFTNRKSYIKSHSSKTLREAHTAASSPSPRHE